MTGEGAAVPAQADTWDRETQRLIRAIFKGRFAVTLLITLIFCAYAIWDPEPWKLVWIAVTGVVIVVLSAIEYWRIHRRPAGIRTIQANLAGVLVAQSSIIFITGGIESPFLPIFVPVALATGMSLRSARQALPVASTALIATALFAAGALGGFIPRATPDFFGLGAGFYQVPVYVWTTAAIIMVLTTAAAIAGSAVRRWYEGIARQMADARRETLEALASRNRELRSVASTVAHELKNPLSSIQGLAQLLVRSAPENTKDRERLDVMLREIGRMSTVLDEFRSFTRPLLGLNLDQVSLTHLIEDLVLLSEGSAQGRRIELDLPEQGLDVVCDPHKVKQALLNLLQNSLDATGAGGIIRIEARVEGESQVRIQVLDTGPGLAPEVVARPFTPGLTTKQKGSGIGLVVARSIAEQHGGGLELANRPEGGCEAMLILPLRATATDEEAL